MDINKFKKVLENNNQIDREISNELCEKAKYFMKIGFTDNDKAKIEYSSVLFMEAIKLNSRCLDAYVCLSFIAYSFNDFENAMIMIKEAETMFPGNESVQGMIRKINDANKEDSIRKLSSKSLSESIKTKTGFTKEADFVDIIKSVFSFFSGKKKNTKKAAQTTSSGIQTTAANAQANNKVNAPQKIAFNNTKINGGNNLLANIKTVKKNIENNKK